MTVVEHDGIRLVIDCGIGFPHGEDRGLGVDIFLPDVRVMRGKPVDAVLITHAHDDHVAAPAHLIRAGGKRLRPALVFLVARATADMMGLR